jgi:hypothetical protein
MTAKNSPPPGVDVFDPQRLAAIRQDAAGPPRPTSPMPGVDAGVALMRKADRADPLSGLAALDPGRRGRRTLPPSEAVQPYDENLADLLRASINADAEPSRPRPSGWPIIWPGPATCPTLTARPFAVM